MFARRMAMDNRIRLLPMLPSRIAPDSGWLVGLLDSGASAAPDTGSYGIHWRFWSHTRGRVPLGT
jgi:hypothetical protein